MSATPQYESAEDVLAANPPIPVSLFDDWWTRKGDAAGTVQARGKNALVMSGDYLGTFSWAAVLEALNVSGIRLPIHRLGYLKELVATKPDSKTLKYLKGPRAT